MKFSINWLKDYVKFSGSSDELAHKLTMSGLEVEKISLVNGETVFECEITPNRADCLNVLGIAREISAIYNKPLQLPKIKNIKTPKEKCSIAVLDKEGCPRYIGRYVENLKVGETPTEIKQKISALGLRSINNVVDITNFVLMETGQPLHAFDYDKLAGGKLIVRRAKNDETIVTIDGVERKLDPSILIIADEKKPVAIAGIMGGKDTEVTLQTKNIILESARFDPILIRRASRKLGLASDSSYRFERGINSEAVEFGSSRALSLILEHAGGEYRRSLDIVSAQKKTTAVTIKISLDYINSYLGAELKMAQCQNILKKLGFGVKAQKNNLVLTPPAFRSDIKAEVDVIEEVARVIGYDKLPMSMPVIPISTVIPKKAYQYKKQIREALVALGFNEVVSYTMTDQKSLNKTLLQGLPAIGIQNPMSQDQELMRPSILPSLLNVLINNLNRGQKDLRLFEIAHNYFADKEQEVLAFIGCGQNPSDWRNFRRQETDFYDLKGAIETVLKEFHIKDIVFKARDHFIFETGFCAEVLKGNISLGYLGKINSQILVNWDIKQKNIYTAFIDLDLVYPLVQSKPRFQAVGEFPPILRDVSLAIKKEIQFEQLKTLAYQSAGEILSLVSLQEEYRGEKVPAGHRALVISFLYQSKSRTLREEEVNDVHNRICQRFTDELGAVRR